MGGAERVFSTLLHYSDAQKFEFHLILIHPREQEAYTIPPHVRVHSLRCSSVLRSLPSLWNKLRTLQPNVVLSTLTHLNCAVLLMSKFLPFHLNVWVQEANHLSENIKHEPLGKLLAILVPWLYPSAKGVLALSQTLQRDLEVHFHIPAQKIALFPNPCDIAVTVPNLLAQQSSRRQSPFGEMGSGPHIIVVGRLSIIKQGEVALAAFARWRESYPNLQLWFCGDGPQRQFLEEVATKLNCSNAVQFVGYQEDLRPWYEYADLLLHTPKLEGLPNVLIEAIAMGCPVQVLSHHGGSEELLTECGISHRYVQHLQHPLFDKSDMLEASKKCRDRYDPQKASPRLFKIILPESLPE